MHTAISFIIVLGILIFVHEFGHFLFAKLFRVKVEKFSLGFGPRLAGVQWGETEYLLSALPLGGYVKMLGENPTDEVDATEADRSFAGRPVWQRFCIVFGGPFFNLAFAVVLFFAVFAVMGLPQPAPTTEVGSVTADSPAAAAGFQPGDEITAMDGVPVTSWEELARRVNDSGGRPIRFTVRRGEATVELTATPRKQETKNIFGEVTGERYMIGIGRSDKVVYEPTGVAGAFTAALAQTWGYIQLTVLGIVKIIQKVVPASELGGPILIAQLAGKQMQAGIVDFCFFMGLVSVNLGILNLLPVPVLDGGHLFFFSIEAIRRKPLERRTQELLQQVGLVLLVSLMLFVFYNDLARIFGQS